MMMNDSSISAYFSYLAQCCARAEITSLKGEKLSHAAAFTQNITRMREAVASGYKLMFVGNGGSAGIASHMAIDHSKNGKLRAMAFNDGAALTCLANDYSYADVFAKQIEFHGREGDVLFAISSSGKSQNILNAVEQARKLGCYVITLSGFNAENPLRKLGDCNFYVDSVEYGFVEVAHVALIHAQLDFHCGVAVPEFKAAA